MLDSVDVFGTFGDMALAGTVMINAREVKRVYLVKDSKLGHVAAKSN